MSNEPVLNAASVIGLLVALLGVSRIVFHFDDDLAGALNVAVGALTPFAAYFLVRSKVTPVGKG